MGRNARRPGPPSFLFGVWGEGETSPENIDALLSEFIEGLGEVTPRFLIPLDKEITTDTIIDVADWAINNKYAVEVIEAAPVRTKVLREIKQEADKVHAADDDKNPIEQVFADALGAKGENARLLFLWAEEDGEPLAEDQRVLFKVIDQGIAALDLTQGLDVLGSEGDDGDGAQGDDEQGDGEDEPDEATVRDWSIRRIRTHAKAVAEQRANAKEKGVPTDDALDEMNKDALLEFLYPDDQAPEPEKPTRSRRTSKSTEAAPEDDGKGITPQRAREMREESEAKGTDFSSRASRRGAAAKAAQPVADGAEDGGEGDDTAELASDALDRIIEAVETLADLADSGDAVDDQIKDAICDLADAFADHIIDRIAARVEKEPETSAIRKEVAPPRPPGKPRKDGATPTRRRTRS